MGKKTVMRLTAVALTFALSIMSTSCSNEISLEPGQSVKSEQLVDLRKTTLISIIDGDTVTTSAGKIRIIGIDAPEHGECGYFEAGNTLAQLATPGDEVFLELPPGQNDHDKYDRLLRYVYTNTGADIGYELIKSGQAVARYDSRDGHPKHPKEHQYHEAQTATLTKDRKVITVDCH